MINFILGGAKSGKSHYAETCIMHYPSPWIYLATGRAWDDEMQHKIIEHQSRRGKGWETIEEPIDIPVALKNLTKQPVLIDCLTLWLTNLMMEKCDISVETDRLIEGLLAYSGDIVLVSNEVGQGIIPMNPMARSFINHAGIIHQKIAAIADSFTFVVAGYPLPLKSPEN